MGNLVSFLVLKPPSPGSPVGEDGGEFSNVTSLAMFAINDSSETSAAEVVCGIDFCSGINENLLPSSFEKRYLLTGIFVVLSILAAVATALFLDPIHQKKEDDEEGLVSRIAATIKHLKKPNQILLVPITIFSGIEQAFILGDFSKYVSTLIIVFVAAAGNLGVCVVLYLWEPSSDRAFVFFVLAGVWGLSDAVWKTQLNSFYGALFRSEEEAAYSNYRLWESVGFAMGFGYSTFLCVLSKLSILIVFLFIGIIGYTAVEIRFNRAKHSYDISKNLTLK
ncbi:protein unc-93 homolog A [Caerostris extrusa]|uniref:Protein unc-93 homolog A n=1 Tax=Caerostris extrusa TaxID=172846 RepID=A0AAV4WIG0_CAEEX|nr:protein unc-93 homolog A [Caerostris extrusa]